MIEIKKIYLKEEPNPDGSKFLSPVFVTNSGDIYQLIDGMGSFGTANAEVKLIGKQEKRESILTIVCNKGIHPIPFELFEGKTHIATEGSLPADDPDKLTKVIESVLKDVAEVILELKPQKIYLVPSGLPIVLAQLQALCMQMISKPASILQLNREKNEYMEINVIPRDVLIK